MLQRLRSLPLTVLCLGAALLFLGAGCASDDDIAPRKDPAAEGAPDVPGAATPAPNAHSAGWW